MIKSNNDLLFYLLNMYKDKHINYKEQNTTKYAIFLKSIKLDYIFSLSIFISEILDKVSLTEQEQMASPLFES